MKTIVLATFSIGLLFSVNPLQGQSTITLQPGTAGKDAEIFSCVPCGYSTRNFGNIGDLCAVSWTNNGNSSKIRGLIQFDLSSIPAGSTINDARLSLYYNPNTDEGKHFKYFGNNSALLQRITQNWNESTVTWNNQPATTTQNQVVIPSSTSSTQDYPNINVTNLIRDMVNNPAASFGMMLKLQYESHFRKLIFASGDYSVASKRPKLTVTYTPPLRTMPETLELTAKPSQRRVFLEPNPAVNETKLSVISEKSGAASIQLFNLTGQLVFEKTLAVTAGNNSTTLAVNSLPKGIYIAKIFTETISETQRLVIE
ncbi:MAG: DNRLRE domain-containing protein [Bacteroidia bacterium]|nr:DNRLRE domain-containing protein [Bacteroidia bacterium]